MHAQTAVGDTAGFHSRHFLKRSKIALRDEFTKNYKPSNLYLVWLSIKRITEEQYQFLRSKIRKCMKIKVTNKTAM